MIATTFKFPAKLNSKFCGYGTRLSNSFKGRNILYLICQLLCKIRFTPSHLSKAQFCCQMFWLYLYHESAFKESGLFEYEEVVCQTCGQTMPDLCLKTHSLKCNEKVFKVKSLQYNRKIWVIYCPITVSQMWKNLQKDAPR